MSGYIQCGVSCSWQTTGKDRSYNALVNILPSLPFSRSMISSLSFHGTYTATRLTATGGTCLFYPLSPSIVIKLVFTVPRPVVSENAVKSRARVPAFYAPNSRPVLYVALFSKAQQIIFCLYSIFANVVYVCCLTDSIGNALVINSNRQRHSCLLFAKSLRQSERRIMKRKSGTPSKLVAFPSWNFLWYKFSPQLFFILEKNWSVNVFLEYSRVFCGRIFYN